MNDTSHWPVRKRKLVVCKNRPTGRWVVQDLVWRQHPYIDGHEVSQDLHKPVTFGTFDVALREAVRRAEKGVWVHGPA